MGYLPVRLAIYDKNCLQLTEVVSLGMPGCEDMKLPISSQGTFLFRSLCDKSLFGDFKVEHKKDKTPVGQPAFGNMAWSLQHTNAGSRIDLRTLFGYKGTIIALQ
jgi:hypothetical protein